MGSKAAREAPEPVPDTTEWWDRQILLEDGTPNPRKITKYVEHPIPMRSVVKDGNIGNKR
jgi:hypothetical protein